MSCCALIDPCAFTIVSSNFFHTWSFFKIFGLLAAAVFGYDTFGTIKYIKELKEQGRDISKYDASAPTDLNNHL